MTSTFFSGLLLFITAIKESPKVPDLAFLLTSAQENIKHEHYQQGIEDYKKISAYVKSKGIYFYYISKYSLMLGDTATFYDYIHQAIVYSPQYYSVFIRDTLSAKPDAKIQQSVALFYQLSKKEHGWLDPSDQINIDTLRAISKTDQYYRLEMTRLSKQYPNYNEFKPKFDSLMDLQRLYDFVNQQKLDAIISRHGFPDLSNTTMEGVSITHAIIQHSPDKKKLKYYISLCKKSLQKSNYPYQYYASTIDRSLVSENKKQIFETNVIMKGETNSVMSSEDKIKLNNRRIIYGLSPIE